MRKFTRSVAVILSLSMTLAMGTPVFAEGETTAPVQSEQTVTQTPAQAKPPKNGFYTKDGKTYYYKSGKLVKDKLGIKIKKSYYKISKKGVVTKVSEAEGLAGIRLEKCGRDLKKAFKWSSTNIQYYGSVKKPKKSQNEVEYYAAYGFKNGRGDCYVMAATFCMMAKVKGYKNVRFVKGSVPQRNGVNGEHAWCEIKTRGKIYVSDPNFAYSYKNNPNAHSGYMFKYNTKGTYKYNQEKVRVRV